MYPGPCSLAEYLSVAESVMEKSNRYLIASPKGFGADSLCTCWETKQRRASSSSRDPHLGGRSSVALTERLPLDDRGSHKDWAPGSDRAQPQRSAECSRLCVREAQQLLQIQE